MNRELFMTLAGGPLRSRKKFDHWSGRDKQENFWDFFEQGGGEMAAVYCGIAVSQIVRTKQRTIEHIIPRRVLNASLRAGDKALRYGATINPFNLAPAHKKFNSARSSFPFDLEDDPIKKRVRLRKNRLENWRAGLDAESEWVVPAPSRGPIARSLLYMILLYELIMFEKTEIDVLINWAKQDVPNYWEILFNDWNHRRLGICNPFAFRPYVCQATTWFKEDLFVDLDL